MPVSTNQPNIYRIFDAHLVGGVGYGSNTYARAGSTDWTHPEGRIWWPVIARRGGTYKVSVTYNRVKGIGGGEFAVTVGGQSLTQTVESGDVTPDLHNGDIVTREIGTLAVPKGRHELSMNAVKIPSGQELMHFIGVTLTPVKR